MNVAGIRNSLSEIADGAPCDAWTIFGQSCTVPSVPTHRPDGRIVGPADLTQNELEAKLRGCELLELKSHSTQIDDSDLNLLEQMAELKLVRLQRRPGRGSFESVEPGGTQRFHLRILGLTAKGEEFLELSGDEARLCDAVSYLTSQNALSFSNLLKELRSRALSASDRQRGTK